MKRHILLRLGVAVLLSGSPAFAWKSGVIPAGEGRPLPQFTSRSSSHWINSKPLSVKELKGKVVLVFVWTFECWNCERSMPWINSLYEKYGGEDFEIVGIHSPEFARERNLKKVRKAVAEHHLLFPNMVDNRYKYWRALKNQYWPAFYVIDRGGTIRLTAVGETHQGDEQARALEKAIVDLEAVQ